MRIRRAHQEAKFAQIPNATLRDDRLSFRARGLLTYLLSLPAGWETSVDKIAATSGEAVEGRDALRVAMRELRQAGYALRYTTRDHRGRWHTIYELYDEPQPTTGPLLESVPGDDAAGEPPARTDDGFSVVGTAQGQRDETPGRTDDGFPGVGKPGVGDSGVPRNTDTNTPPTPHSADTAPEPDHQPANGGGEAETQEARQLLDDLRQRDTRLRLTSTQVARLAPLALAALAAGWTTEALGQHLAARLPADLNPYALVRYRLTDGLAQPPKAPEPTPLPPRYRHPDTQQAQPDHVAACLAQARSSLTKPA